MAVHLKSAVFRSYHQITLVAFNFQVFGGVERTRGLCWHQWKPNQQQLERSERSGRRYSRSLGKLKLAVSVLTVRPEEQLFLVKDRRLNTFLVWAIFALLFGRYLSPMKVQVLPLRLPQEVRQERQTVSRNHLLQSTAPPNVSLMYCLQINCF